MKLIAYLTVLILSTPYVIFAQDGDNKKDEEEKKNEISIFLGGTYNQENTGFTIGLDYQYRITKIVGVGALIDYGTPDIGSVLIGPSLYLHGGNFEFTIAPVVEFSDEDVAGVLRLGVGYVIEVSKFSISPEIFFDTERDGEEAFVFGVRFGYAF